MKGYCPSFVTLYGGAPASRPAARARPAAATSCSRGLPAPRVADASRSRVNVLVDGHRRHRRRHASARCSAWPRISKGKGCSVLDVTGLAQKNGPVTSHVRIAQRSRGAASRRASRAGGADLVLGCDIVVTAGADVLCEARQGAHDRDRERARRADRGVRLAARISICPPTRWKRSIRSGAGDEACHFLPRPSSRRRCFGDAIATNLFLLGYALQRGCLPVGLAALERAIELNGRAVKTNQRALAWGRLAAHDFAAVERAARPALRRRRDRAGDLARSDRRPPRGVPDRVPERGLRARATRSASRRRRRASESARRERATLAGAVARYYFKLLAYKDEYEVARLWTDDSFRKQLEREFEAWKRVELHLAPQIANPRDPDTGRARRMRSSGRGSSGPSACSRS